MATTPQERYRFRKLRVRKKILGTPERPRLSVYGSLRHIYAQVIDDTRGHTLASASSIETDLKKTGGCQAATVVGEQVAKKALEVGIKKVVFDRGARLYHGRVKAVAEAARQAGLEF